MTRLLSALIRSHHRPFVLALWLVALMGAGLWAGARPAYALPEFSTRTNEPCATCHVNPGGGGPRTMRGMLWAARGKPDQVPTLPNLLLAPGVDDPRVLYDIACAACHGREGQGLYAMGLVGTGVGERSTRSFVTRGIPALGMPGFEGQFAEAQLDALVAYVTELASGEAVPQPVSFRLPPAQFRCTAQAPGAECGAPRSHEVQGN